MSELKILVVRIGGGYLKALLPDRQETVFGRDYRELDGRLKRLRFRETITLVERKRPR